MYVYVPVYIYVYTYENYIYIYIYMCISTCIYTHTCIAFSSHWGAGAPKPQHQVGGAAHPQMAALGQRLSRRSFRVLGLGFRAAIMPTKFCACAAFVTLIFG